jgi:arabinogalactan oligomer / maltooligosaccharide transport system substrate-binding protein/arabinogalactan oligomer / maltooligosaccharide transport system permease protein
MNVRSRSASLQLALLAFLVLFVWPARARAEPLTLWHAYRGAEKRALEQVLRDFERSPGGAPVQALQVPHDAYAAKLTAAVPRDAGPDVFIESHELLGDYLEQGVIAPVPGLLPDEHHAFPPRALAALRHDGKLYGLPLAMKCLALYVNTSLVHHVPATLEGIAALKSSLPKGVYPLAYEAENMYFHAAVLSAFGGVQLRPGGGFGFVGPAAERSTELVRRFIQDRVVPDEASGALVEELFSSGKAAFVIDGPWFASDVAGRVPYRVALLPKLAATGKPMRPYLTVEAAVLTPRGARNPAAVRLLHFLAGVESADVRARVGRQVVARTELPPSARGDAFLTTFAEQAKSAVLMPSSVRMRATWEPAQRALRKILNGTVAPGPALREAQRRFNDVVRPPPGPVSPTPLLIVMGLACFAGALWIVRETRGGRLGPALRKSLPAYGWVAHAVIAVTVLVLVPIVVGAAISLYAGRPGHMVYVGFANFVSILTARGGRLLGHGSFYLVLGVTILWTLSNIVLHVVLGFTLGLLLSRPALRLRPVYRVLLIVPWAVPSYVTALAWKGMFSRQFGAVSALLKAVGVEPFSWWARFPTAFAADVATNVWLGFPFMMVVTLGALTAVPKEVLEAAEVDGATRWQRLTRVTIPSVLPMMLPAVLLGAIWTFNMFNVVFLVSGGEPDGTTDILVSEAYRWAFTREAQYGYAAAYSVLIFLLLAFGSRLMNRMSGQRAFA